MNSPAQLNELMARLTAPGYRQQSADTQRVHYAAERIHAIAALGGYQTIRIPSRINS